MKPYLEIRGTLRSGDLVAWKGKTLFARLISWWTSSPYTHVGIIYVHKGRVFVLEARPHRGVVLTAASQLKDFYWFRGSGTMWQGSAERFAFQMLGLPYSWRDIANVVFGKRLRASGFICSEYVAKIYQCMGFLPHIENPTPGVIVDAVIANTQNRQPIKVYIRSLATGA